MSGALSLDECSPQGSLNSHAIHIVLRVCMWEFLTQWQIRKIAADSASIVYIDTMQSLGCRFGQLKCGIITVHTNGYCPSSFLLQSLMRDTGAM